MGKRLHGAKEGTVTCSLCKGGQMHSGVATLTLERDGAVVVVRDVPALICDQCGDRVFGGEATAAVLNAANDAVRRGVQFEVLLYDAVASQEAA